jgi:hypothetical protein
MGSGSRDCAGSRWRLLHLIVLLSQLAETKARALSTGRRWRTSVQIVMALRATLEDEKLLRVGNCVKLRTGAVSQPSQPLRGAYFGEIHTRGDSLRSLTLANLLPRLRRGKRSPEGCENISPGLSEAIDSSAPTGRGTASKNWFTTDNSPQCHGLSGLGDRLRVQLSHSQSSRMTTAHETSLSCVSET